MVRGKHVSRNLLPDFLLRYLHAIEKDSALLAIQLAFLYARANELPVAVFELLSKFPTLELRLILGFPIGDCEPTIVKGADSDNFTSGHPRCEETKVLLHMLPNFIDCLVLDKAKIP